MLSPTWAYGVTTVPTRLSDLLPRTLKSLDAAGFPNPRLFIDGTSPRPCLDKSYDITWREPAVRTHGNWVLSMYELYIRQPNSTYFVIFQDDFVTMVNLREYLERTVYQNPAQQQVYYNLYTFPANEGEPGWHESNQRGFGAVGLVFNYLALEALFTAQHLFARPTDPRRGHKSVDGGIVSAMRKQGYKELVHTPSLLQHTGLQSSMGNKRQPLATSFYGESFDALDMLK